LVRSKALTALVLASSLLALSFCSTPTRISGCDPSAYEPLFGKWVVARLKTHEEREVRLYLIGSSGKLLKVGFPKKAGGASPPSSSGLPSYSPGWLMNPCSLKEVVAAE